MSNRENNPSFLFTGELISGKDAYEWLKFNLPKAHGMSSIASCYVKKDALERIFTPGIGQGRLLVRWRLSDIIQGSSDLEIFEIVIKNGWQLYLSQNFHGKIYSLPGFGILVGSANATLSGLSIYGNGNVEINTLVNETKENSAVIDELFSSAVPVTHSLFLKIKEFISTIDKFDSKDAGGMMWPPSISGLLIKKNVGKLFVSDCFRGPFSKRPNYEDLSLLGFNEDSFDEHLVAIALSDTKIYQWLLKTCTELNRPLKFGELTQLLHNSLLDNPLPYRSTIKDLLINLLSWVDYFKKDEIKITRPNFSQQIEIVK